LPGARYYYGLAMIEKLGIVFDPVFLLHNPGPTHPESPKRLVAVQEAIKGLDLAITGIPARVASREELCLVHSPGYVDQILSMKIDGIMQLDPDTAVSEHSPEAARRAVGGVIEAVDRVMQGELKKVFCAVRPPGHHAEPDRAMGFCIFNNIGIGAAHALSRWNLERVAIIDWDLHHGNGTQDVFYDTDEVLYISLHQYPFFPGTGKATEQGEGKGLGFNINLPMVPGSSDEDFRTAFQEIIIPALTNYEPELVLISAGFDAHRDDPLGDLYLTTEYFGEMTAIINEIASVSAKGRVISVFEGGYNLQALKDCVSVHLRELVK
jgi:acetoin utilization deacetylase AcuC-like enzyme